MKKIAKSNTLPKIKSDTFFNGKVQKKMLTKNEALFRERKRRDIIKYLLIALVMILVVEGFLFGYWFHSGEHYNVNTEIVQPKEVVYVENNITNTQVIEKQVDVNLEYLQDCTALIKPDGTQYLYCPN